MTTTPEKQVTFGFRPATAEEIAVTTPEAEGIEETHNTREVEEATVLTEDELAFIDDMAQAIFDQADKEELRPYVLTALCGSIASNLVRGSEGQLEVDTVLKFIELATKSQLD